MTDVENNIEHFAAYCDFVKKLRAEHRGKSGSSKSCPVCKTQVFWQVFPNGDVYTECGTSKGVSFNPA